MKNKILINLNSKMYDLTPKSRDWQLVEELAIGAGYTNLVAYANADRWNFTIKDAILDLGKRKLKT